MEKGPRYKTCKHSTGNVGVMTVEVLPTCPYWGTVAGHLVARKGKCKRCKFYEEDKRWQK